MDLKQIIVFLVPSIARGAAWVLAGWLGLQAAQAQSLGLLLAQWGGAGVLIGVALYTAVKGKQKLLMTPAPEKTNDGGPAAGGL